MDEEVTNGEKQSDRSKCSKRAKRQTFSGFKELRRCVEISSLSRPTAQEPDPLTGSDNQLLPLLTSPVRLLAVAMMLTIAPLGNSGARKDVCFHTKYLNSDYDII